MSLRNYMVSRDKFEAEPSPALGMSFPCRACKWRVQADDEEPCRSCDHNMNADRDEPDTANASGEGRGIPRTLDPIVGSSSEGTE